MPALALPAPPASPGITLQTTLQNGIVISDLPGPTGGIVLKSTTGATLIVNDTGIYIQNGKGASIVMTGPTVTVNNGALDGDLRGCDDARILLHLGATVLCSHGGQAQPTAPNPRVLVSGQPVGDDGGAVRRRRLPVRRRAAGNGPCVTAQWVTAATRVLANGAAAGAAGQPGDLRADRHAADRRRDADAGDRRA